MAAEDSVKVAANDQPAKTKAKAELNLVTPVPSQKEAGKDQEKKADLPCWDPDQTPADFLRLVGQVAKARWRQQYRPPPPTPAADRLRTAVTLGYLVGESYLCLQTMDAQQFRNNNQEINSYARTLGLGDKVSPLVLSQAKLAEEGKWEELEDQVVKGYNDVESAFKELRDDDLAVLLKVGMWLRTLEVVSSVVIESADADHASLCVGSPVLVEELRNEFMGVFPENNENEVLAELSMLLDFLWRNWARDTTAEVTHENVILTQSRLMEAARKVSLR